MIYGLLIISLTFIGWGIAYDHIPFYFPLLGIAVVGLVMVYQLFRGRATATQSTNKNQQTPPTTPTPSPPTPTTTPKPASTSKSSGWMCFVGGAALVAVIGIFYFSVTGIGPKEPKKKIFHIEMVMATDHHGKPLRSKIDNRIIYEAKETKLIPAGEYLVNNNSNIFPCKEATKPLFENVTQFTLDREREIYVVSTYSNIVIIRQ